MRSVINISSVENLSPNGQHLRTSSTIPLTSKQPQPKSGSVQESVQMPIKIRSACTHLDTSHNDIREHNKRETHHIE